MFLRQGSIFVGAGLPAMASVSSTPTVNITIAGKPAPTTDQEHSA